MIARRVSVILFNAAVLRRVALVESSIAFRDLRLWFNMAFDVYGGPVRVLLVWLFIKTAPALLLPSGMFCERGCELTGCLCVLGLRSG